MINGQEKTKTKQKQQSKTKNKTEQKTEYNYIQNITFFLINKFSFWNIHSVHHLIIKSAFLLKLITI